MANKYVYNMQDRSAPGTRVDYDLKIQDVFRMTDFSNDEADAILDLRVGDSILLNGWIYIERVL